MTLAMPSFSELIQKTRANEMRQSLFHMMQFSRQTAINHNRTITICQIKDFKKGECVLDKHWQFPYYVFFDANGDKILNLNSNENNQADTLFRQYAAVGLDEDLHTTQKYFYFSSPGTTGRNGTITYCPPNDHGSAASVVVMRSGRVRYSKPSEIKC
jgi:Tfp pilus assembly protein FimT